MPPRTPSPPWAGCTSIGGRRHQACADTRRAILTHVEEIIVGYLPDAPPDKRTRAATMTVALFKAGLDLVIYHEGAERDAYFPNGRFPTRHSPTGRFPTGRFRRSRRAARPSSCRRFE